MKDSSSSTRHIGYMKQAARILGLLGDHDEISQCGYELVELSDRTVTKFLSIRFELSKVGRLWMRWSNVQRIEELQSDTAEKFLAAKGFSESMVKRRGRTLKKWLQAFQGAS